MYISAAILLGISSFLYGQSTPQSTPIVSVLTHTRAVISWPTNGVTLDPSDPVIYFTPHDAAAIKITLGTAPGTSDIYDGPVFAPYTWEHSVPNIPTNGEAVHLTFYQRSHSNIWSEDRLTYYTEDIDQPRPRSSEQCQDAPALPPIADSDPGKSIVVVKPGDNLSSAVYEADANTVVLIEPGVYQLSSTLSVTANNITIRGNSNSCDAVRLVGMGMDNAAGASSVSHGIYTKADFTKIQNLTIENVYYHAIAIDPDADNPEIYNVAMLDTGEQFVKASTRNDEGSDNGRLEYSLMKYTNGSPVTDHGAGFGYTQGMSLHNGDNWIIRHNRFENINTPDNADHIWNPAFLAWGDSRNTVVENNQFIDVDRAIAFGLWERNGQNDHTGGIIRNNMISMRENMYSQWRKSNADAPIIIWNSPYAQVSHNTVITNGNTPYAIETRFNSTGVVLSNNLSDSPIGDRSGMPIHKEGNKQINDRSVFQDPANGDLHLVSAVGGITNAVNTLDNVAQDYDGQIRSGVTTDAGADQR